jgi:hypothetical protein
MCLPPAKVLVLVGPGTQGYFVWENGRASLDALTNKQGEPGLLTFIHCTPFSKVPGRSLSLHRFLANSPNAFYLELPKGKPLIPSVLVQRH